MARSREQIIDEIYRLRLKHGPKQAGGPGPCEPDCRKCALEEELKNPFI